MSRPPACSAPFSSCPSSCSRSGPWPPPTSSRDSAVSLDLMLDRTSSPELDDLSDDELLALIQAEIPHYLLRRFRSKLPFVVVGDRKSTRLNSSHRTISYAVFCL